MPTWEDNLGRARASYESAYGPPAGASPDAIDRLEAEVGCPLPAAYRAFLAWAGGNERPRRATPFSHNRVRVADVPENGRTLDDLLRHFGARHLAGPQVLVWAVHEVYLSWHFALPAVADDPTCYCYSEGEPTLRDEGTFTEIVTRWTGPPPPGPGGGA